MSTQSHILLLITYLRMISKYPCELCESHKNSNEEEKRRFNHCNQRIIVIPIKLKYSLSFPTVCKWMINQNEIWNCHCIVYRFIHFSIHLYRRLKTDFLNKIELYPLINAAMNTDDPKKAFVILTVRPNFIGFFFQERQFEILQFFYMFSSFFFQKDTFRYL